MAAPRHRAYGATKHAVVGLSRGLRAEAAGRGVKVTVVCRGYVGTSILRNGVDLQGPAEDSIRRTGLRPYPVEKAARRILRGVARNEETIVFPLHAHAAQWIARLAPWFIERRVAGEMAAHRAL